MTSHPTDETIAVYADGRFPEEDREAFERHLAECDDCHAIWQSAADYREFDRQEGTVVQGRFGRFFPAAAAAAAAIIVVLMIPRIREQIPGFEPSGMAVLVDASASLKHRRIEPRLSGDFAHRQFKSPTRGGHEETKRKLDKEANRELMVAYKSESVAAHPKSDARERATAQMFLKQFDKAIETLEKELATQGRDPNPDLLNDLAVAHLVKGNDEKALENADRAWSLAKKPTYLFNRALALEALRRDQAAIDAWEEYRRLDSDSGWAKEAEEHIRRLRKPV